MEYATYTKEQHEAFGKLIDRYQERNQTLYISGHANRLPGYGFTLSLEPISRHIDGIRIGYKHLYGKGTYSWWSGGSSDIDSVRACIDVLTELVKEAEELMH